MADDLVHLSATDALAAFAARTLSPVELLDALIERVEAIEPAINAVCDRRYDEARAEAEASGRRWLGLDGGPRALEGLPVAAKEEHPMRGRSWAQGSMALTDEIAEEDHPIIERLQAAGAVIHIRTTTPEFCCAGFCHSSLWGVTRNPWNLDMSPGGSSGGSGAALAAGYAPLATGSDIGGSIRIPASFSGVVGFKPPYGRVPALPPFNLDQYCHDGPLARTVADCALIEDVIAGPDRRDVVAIPNPPRVSGLTADLTGVRIALAAPLGDFPADDEVLANTRAVAGALTAAGAVVEEVEVEVRLDEVWAAAERHFAGIMGPSIAKVDAEVGHLLNAYTRAFARRMSAAAAGTFYDGLVVEGRVWAPLGALFQEFDALVCPTVGTVGLVAGDDYLDTSIQIGTTSVDHHLKALCTLPFNVASRCPVLSVPSGRASNGVPTGVQLVGRTYDDAMPFRLGHAIEAAGFGWADPGWRPAL